MVRRRARPPAWSIPAWYAAAAVLAALYLPRLEASFGFAISAGMEPASLLAMFSAIASGMIALTGIVFSLAFVMVQFSATAYSPRLVLWIARDALLWHAVGVFSATFLYSLGVMAWVQHADAGGGVPFFSAWLVIFLLLASVALFIALIERLSLLQVHRMLAFTAGHGRAVIEQTYPPIEARPRLPDPASLGTLTVAQALVHDGPPCALQALDVPALVELARRAGAIVEVLVSAGDTLVLGTPILCVHGAAPIEPAALRKAVVTGPERTFEQDPKYAIRLIVDIAIRALSPAVNDPTTAVQALDHLEDLLRRLGRSRLEIGAVHDGNGALRVVISYPAWEDFLALTFDEIRYYGRESVQVMRRMRAFAADLAAALPAERQPPLREHQRRLDATIARAFGDAAERQDASREDRQGLGVPRRSAR